jgi:hypothetical protein
MSAATDENNELAKILSRINTLMGDRESQLEVIASEMEIPELTEIYEGGPLSFTAHSSDEFPGLVEDLNPNTAEPDPEIVEALLIEMTPMIQDIIRRAVRQEIENVEQPLSARLELEVMQSLREKLKSRLAE